MKKYCKKCGAEKELTAENFAWNKDRRLSKGGFWASMCRGCASKYNSPYSDKYNSTHVEQLKARRKELSKKYRTEHPIVGSWKHMMGRCYKPTDCKYRWYGAEGIAVCNEWHSFQAFEAWASTHGWAKGKDVHRINWYGHYTPQNCCFMKHREHSLLHKRGKNGELEY